MPRQKFVKPTRCSIKTEVPWRTRKRSSCDDPNVVFKYLTNARRAGWSSLKRKRAIVSMTTARIKQLDEEIPTLNAEQQDIAIDYNCSTITVKASKKRIKHADEGITKAREQLAKAIDAKREAVTEMAEVRQDREDMKEQLASRRDELYIKLDQRAIFGKMHSDILDKVDGALPRHPPLLLDPYLMALDEDTEDDIPSDCDNCGTTDDEFQGPCDHYVPTTPDYEVQ